MSKDIQLSNLDTLQVYNLNDITPFDYDVDVVDGDLIVKQSNGVDRNGGKFKGQTGLQTDNVLYDIDGNLIQELNTGVDQNLGKLRRDKTVSLSYNVDSQYGIYTGNGSVVLENWFNAQYADTARYTISTTDFRYIIPIVTWQGTTTSQTLVSTIDGLKITSNSITTGFNLTGIVDRNPSALHFRWNTGPFIDKFVTIELPEIQYIDAYVFQNESIDHAVHSLEVFVSLNGVDYTKVDEILNMDVSGLMDVYNRQLPQQEPARFIKLVPISGVGNGGIGSFNILTLNEPEVNYQLSFSPFVFDSTYFDTVQTPTEIQLSTKEINVINTKLLKWENYTKFEHRRVLENIPTSAGVTVRNLNATAVNNLNITTSLPNFILPSGVYYIKGQAQTYLTNFYSVSLRDTSNNIYLMGTSNYSSDAQAATGTSSTSFMSGIVYLPVDTTMRMMQYASSSSAPTSGASQGGGVLDTSDPNFNYAVIAELEIWKIAEYDELDETGLDTYWNNVVLLMNSDQIEDNSKYKYPLTHMSGTVIDNTTIGTSGFGSGYQTSRIKSYPTINHNFGNGDFTIELNYYATTLPTNTALISDDLHVNIGSFGLYFSNSTTLIFVIGTSTNTGIDVLRHTSPNFINQWNSVVVTRSGSTFNLFFNGLLVQTGTSSLSLNSNRLYVGASASLNTAFPGTISNVRVTKGVARYNERYFPLSVPLSKDTVDVQTVTETALDPHWNNVVLLMNGTSLGDSSKFAYPMNQIAGTGSLVDNTTIGTGGFGNGYQGAVWLSQYGHLNHLLSNSNYTFEVSFYTSDISNVNNLVLWSDGLFLNAGTFNLYILNSTTIRHNYGSNSTTATIIRDTVIPGGTVNTWVHFCIVREGNVFRYFVNGILSGSVTSALTFVSNQLRIGGNNFQGNNPFNGTLANIRLTKGVARYSANYTPPSAIFTKDTP